MDDDGLGYADEGEEEDWDRDQAPQLHHVPRPSKHKDKLQDLTAREPSSCLPGRRMHSISQQ